MAPTPETKGETMMDQAKAATGEPLYLIWSHEHSGWWRDNRRGYTPTLKGAGIYTRKEALDVCRRARLCNPADGPFNELPVALSDVAEFMAPERDG